MKFIMVETHLEGGPQAPGMIRYVPLIFPNFLVHKDADKWFTHWLRRAHNMDAKTVSAGMIGLGDVRTYGDSETLGLKPHEDDARLIDSYEYGHGLRDKRRT